MATDIELACNLIQAQVRTLTTVQNAPNVSAYPTSIAATQCPYVITWPSEGSWSQKGHGWKQDERTFRVIAFVEPLGQGELPTRAIEAVQLLAAMRNLFALSAIDLDSGTTSGYQITVESAWDTPHTDTGLVSNLQFGGAAFHGFELRLRVRTNWIV